MKYSPEEVKALVADKKPRTIKLIISDDGDQKFRFDVEGDLDRVGKIPPEAYSAAEYWGVTFFNLCQEHIQKTQSVKKMNREERRNNS